LTSEPGLSIRIQHTKETDWSGVARRRGMLLVVGSHRASSPIDGECLADASWSGSDRGPNASLDALVRDVLENGKALIQLRLDLLIRFIGVAVRKILIP
jgi:hypothetical protein